MRPVNLIPAEERRGGSAPSRAGALSYVVVGVLAVVLLGVTGVVLTNKQVADRKAEIASLEDQEAEAMARSQSLASYVSFQQVEESRTATISSLAQSRFDWERVLRELSLVLPARVWLTSLRGTVSPDVDIEGDANQLRGSIPGPALELVGCGKSQKDVARFVAALNDIDGVTRVAASGAEEGDLATASSGGTGGGSSEDCRTQPGITQFQIVAAFDAAPVASVPTDGTTAPTTPTTPPSTTDSSTSAPTETASTGEDGGVSDANAGKQAQESVNEGKEKTDKAMNLVGAG